MRKVFGCCAIAVLIAGCSAPERQMAPPGAHDVYALLDEGRGEELRPYSPVALVEALRKGRPRPEAKSFEGIRTIRDGLGREIEVVLRIPERPTGLLILLHGIQQRGNSIARGYFDRFAATEHLILACPTAGKEPGQPANEDNYGGILGEELDRWWSYRDGNEVLTLVQEMKREFAIDENRVYLAGYSMGGFGTWNLGLRYADRFAAIVPMAGGISRGEFVNRKGDHRMRGLLVNARNLPIYILHGRRDDVVPVRFDRMSVERLEGMGYEHEYVEPKEGGHVLDMKEGGPLMSAIQGWLGPRRRQASPERVCHYALGPYMNRAYWVRIDEFSDRTAEVDATISSGNRIEVEARGVRKLTLYLDERLVDLSVPVQVEINGRTASPIAVEPSLEAVLESWREREDRELVYAAKITVTVDP